MNIIQIIIIFSKVKNFFIYNASSLIYKRSFDISNNFQNSCLSNDNN